MVEAPDAGRERRGAQRAVGGGDGQLRPEREFEVRRVVAAECEAPAEREDLARRRWLAVDAVPFQPSQARAFANMRAHGLAAETSPLVQLICTLRKTRSACGISAVNRPSAVVTAVKPSGLPFGLAG
jgi:hypothetical protein